MQYNKRMQAAGVLLSLDGLHPPSMGARVSFADGQPLVTDGPYIEAAETIGGYWLIDVESKDEAIAWARRCPAGEVVEVRRIHEMDEYSADVQQAADGLTDMQNHCGGRR